MAKKSSDELLSDILNLLDDVIKENKKAAKNAGVSNTPNMAILSYDAANMKVLGDSLKILSSAIIDIGKVSDKQITNAVKNIKLLGEAIQSIKLTKEDTAGIMQMATTLVALNGMFKLMTENFFKTYFTFSPLKARILGRRLAKFYKIIFKKLKELCFSDTIKVLQDIPDDKKFADKIVNLEKLIKIIRDIPMKDVLKMWAMGILIGEKTGANIGKFFAAIVDSLTKNDPDGKKAELAIKIAKSVTRLIGVLTLSLVIMVGLAYLDTKKLLIGIGLLTGLILISWVMMATLSSKKFKENAKDGRNGAMGIAILLGALTLSLVILILVAKAFPIKQILIGVGLLVGLVMVSALLMWFLSSKKFKKQSKEALWGVAAIVLMVVGMTIAMLICIAVGKRAKEILKGGGIVLLYTGIAAAIFILISKLLKPKTIITGIMGVGAIIAMTVSMTLAMMLYVAYMKLMKGLTAKDIAKASGLMLGMIAGVTGVAMALGAILFFPISAGIFWAGFGAVEAISLMIASISGAMLLFAQFVKETAALKDEDFKNAMSRITGNPGMIDTLRQIISAMDEFSFSALIKMGIIGRNLKPIFEALSQFVDIIQKMAKMEILDHYDDEGKPVFRKMKNKEFVDAAKAVTDAFTYFLTTLSTGLESIGNADYLRKVIDALFPPKLGGLFSFFKKTEKKGIGDIVPCISQFVDVIIKFASMTIPTEWNSDGAPIKYRRVENKEFIAAAKTVTLAFVAFLKELSNGMTLISNASYLTSIITQLFPPPKKVRTGLFRSEMVQQPGVGVVILAISDFMGVILQMAAAQVPDEWSSDGTPIHYRKIEDKEFIQAATVTTKCFVLFLKELSKGMDSIGGAAATVLRLLGDTGVEKVTEAIGYLMLPLILLAVGKVLVEDQVYDVDLKMMQGVARPLVRSMLNIISLVRDKLAEKGWYTAADSSQYAFTLMNNFSRSLLLLFSKTGQVKGDKTEGKEYLVLSNVKGSQIFTAYLLLELMNEIKTRLSDTGWDKGKSNADKAFYMLLDFSQGLAMLFNLNGFVKGKASSGKEYIQIRKVKPEHIERMREVSHLAFQLAKYITNHYFSVLRAKDFSEQMKYVSKGLSYIKPHLTLTPFQIRDIAQSLRELDAELIEKQQQRTEAIQLVSSNFRDMAENIQKLNDTLSRSMSLMNRYNRMRLFFGGRMFSLGAEAIVRATEKVKDTVQDVAGNTKPITEIAKKEEKKEENMQQFAQVVSLAITTALNNWAKQNKEITVKFDESPNAIFGNVEMG